MVLVLLWRKRDTSFMAEYNGENASGVPKYYANWDESNVVVAPTPDSAYAVQLNYTVTPPHFTVSNSTYLSTYSQNMLLHGVLTEAYGYLKGPLDIYNLYKKSMMMMYKVLLFNKWVNVEDLNMMTVYHVW
jgi:hypothetical protein